MSDKLIESYVMDTFVYVECFVYEDDNGKEYSIYLDQDGEEVNPGYLSHEYESNYDR